MVVDSLWLAISPNLTEKENWKTNQQKKNQMLAKLFLVKFVVNYYPFFYIAFIKRYVEDIESEVCMKQLRTNLVSFFLIRVVTNCVEVVMSILLTRRAIRAEIDHAHKVKPGAK